MILPIFQSQSPLNEIQSPLMHGLRQVAKIPEACPLVKRQEKSFEAMHDTLGIVRAIIALKSTNRYGKKFHWEFFLRDGCTNGMRAFT